MDDLDISVSFFNGKFTKQHEREHYEYIVVGGQIVHKQTGNLLDTNSGLPRAKWIFVMSTSEKLYAGEVSGSTVFFYAQWL